MPRRLGDDPLGRAKAAAAEAQVATVTQSSRSSARVTTRGAYNDVFFRRRGEGQVAASELKAAEVPEITEISEIPEIREASAAPIAEEAIAPEVKLIEPRTTIEEVVAHLSVSRPVESVAVAEPVPMVAVATDAKASASVAAAPQPPSQPKEGGFFKRLFGKFGK